MSSSAAEAVWEVIVCEGPSRKVLSLSADLSMAEVRRRWLQETGRTTSDGYFFTQEGARLPPERRLRDVGDARLGMAKLVFKKWEEQAWDVIISRSDGSSKRMYSCPVSSLAAEVCGRWREDVGESADGAFFTQEHAPLRPDHQVGEIGDGRLQTAKLTFEKAVDQCDVIVEWRERPGRKHIFSVATSAAVREVYDRWSQEEGAAVDGCFLTSDGSGVGMEEKVGDVQAMNPDMQLLRLVFERSLKLAFHISGGDARRECEVRLSQTPASLRARVCEMFGLDEDCDFRLRTATSVLDPRLPFSRQRLAEGEPVMVELGFSLTFLELWERCRVRLEGVFPSDACEEVLQEALDAVRAAVKVDDGRRSPEEEVAEPETPPDAPPWHRQLRERLRLLEIAYAESQSDAESVASEADDLQDDVRVLVGEKVLPFTGDVGKALSLSGAPRGVGLDVARRRTVAVLDGERIRQRQVWPSQTVGDVAGQAAMVAGGELRFRGDRLCDVGVPANGLLIVNPLLLHLHLSRGGRETVRLAPVATVGDVRRIACGFERHSCVHLRCHAETLTNDDRTLAKAGLCDGDHVFVSRSDLHIAVTLGKRTVSWRPHTSTVRLSDLLMALVDSTQLSIAELRRTTLQCVGCGRTLKDEGSCVIPVACCDARSTRLMDWTTAESTEAEETSQIGRLKMKIKSLESENERIVKEKEALDVKHQRLLEKRRQWGDRYQQLLKEKKELEERDCQVKADEHEKLQVSHEALTKDKQRLTKTNSNMTKEKEKLKRANHDLLREKGQLSTENGDLRVELERLKKSNSDLRNENKGLKTWNDILSEINEANKNDRLFFIQTDQSKDYPRVSLSLPPAPSTGQVRVAIAKYLGWRPEETRLGRRMGLVDGARVFWADAGGRSDFVFANTAGRRFLDAHVKDWEREDLRDDADLFPLIQKLANVVRVSRRR